MALGFMALGMILIPVGDAIAKYLSSITTYSPAFLAWARFILGALIMLPFAFIKGQTKSLSHTFYFRQSVRGVLIALTVVTIIKAVSLSPIAEVFGAFFLGPVLAVILSVFLLGERATVAEWISVCLGFVGVLLVVQPEFIFGLGSEQAESLRQGHTSVAGLYWALLAGVFYGLFLVATRWAAGTGPPLAQVSLQFTVAALVLFPFAFSELTGGKLDHVHWLIMMALSSVFANYLSILALARAQAAALAPVVYMQIVSATVIGLLLFNEKLGLIAAVGLCIVILSGFFRIKLPGQS